MSPMPKTSALLAGLRLDELAVLVDVAAAGSIAAAARRMGVPKSTVGRRIRRLEEDFGVSLVRRMTRGPALTDQGRVLAGVAAPHIAALRDVSGALGRDRAEIYGRLRITAPTDLGAFVLAPLVAAFVAQHPRVHVEVDQSIRVVDLVGEGFDFALRAVRDRLPSSTLVGRRLARLDLGLYAGSAYVARRGLPRRVEDLEQHEHVLFSGITARGSLALHGPKGAMSIAVNGGTSCNDFFFVREAVLRGAGIGLLPWFLASTDVAAGRLVRILPEHQHAGAMAYLVHPPLKPLPPKHAAFKAFLLEHAPRLLIDPQTT